ncbi:helix-turn-helix domain-containing protein [Vibrio profundi]|uniref:helix-turn-helix domain-containing protein n=1 Tax=Vibrio profundi TaxID=1774960 RepID=UPI0037370B16
MDLKIVQPKHKLANHIQAIWSVRVSESNSHTITKQLYCDGGSGITFLIQGKAKLNGVTVEQPILFQQYTKHTQTLTLTEGARLSGIRFHPGMLPVSLEPLFSNNQSNDAVFQDLYAQLRQGSSQSANLSSLYRWCVQHTELDSPMLAKRAGLLDQVKQGKIGEQFQSSQRQIERNFRQWIGMSPKYFQRLRRVHFSMLALRNNPDISLSELAFAQGFSDQAHMTREFNTFILATPGEISQKLKRRDKR